MDDKTYLGSSSSVTSLSGTSNNSNNSSPTPSGFLTLLRVDYNFIDVEYRYGLSQVGAFTARLNLFFVVCFFRLKHNVHNFNLSTEFIK